MRVRRANLDDLPAILELEGQSAAAAHWPRQQYEAMFRASAPALTEHLVLIVDGRETEATDEVSSGDFSLPAFLVAHRVGAQWELQNLVVAPTQRRRGIGSMMVRELIAIARTQGGTWIFLEVRESNHAARALYMQLGFSAAGLRKGYYSNPPESAILCELRL